jgi:hypothetical protein
MRSIGTKAATSARVTSGVVEFITLACTVEIRVMAIAMQVKEIVLNSSAAMNRCFHTCLPRGSRSRVIANTARSVIAASAERPHATSIAVNISMASFTQR